MFCYFFDIFPLLCVHQQGQRIHQNTYVETQKFKLKIWEGQQCRAAELPRDSFVRVYFKHGTVWYFPIQWTWI